MPNDFGFDLSQPAESTEFVLTLSNTLAVFIAWTSAWIGWLVRAVVAVFNALVGVANLFAGILSKAANFFRYIWDNFFKRVFSKLFDAVLKAHDWLESKLGPILRFLQKLRAFIDNVMNKYVKPIMNIIQRMRQFLTVLKLFHVKFAEKLDARLLQIEVKMAAVFIEARQILNGVIDAVNLVIDPTKLLKHPILIISIRRSLPALVRSVTGLPLSYWTGTQDGLSFAVHSDCSTSLGPPEPVDIKLPSQFLGDNEGIPLFGFMSDTTEPTADDVDSIDPLPVFAAAMNQAGGCTDVDAKVQELSQLVKAAILDAADVSFNLTKTSPLEFGL